MRRLATFENGEIVYCDMTPEEEATFDSAEIEETPSQLDRLEAQILYTALMTDTLIEGNENA